MASAGLWAYILRRLLWAPVILLAVSLVTFALGRFGPGDPVRVLAGQHNDPETVQRIREERGLDEDFFTQYRLYLAGLLRGDLGTSFKYYGLPVTEVVLPRLWVTFQYNLLAFLLVFALGVPLGVWAALRQGTWRDPLTMGPLLALAAVPVLVLVPLLQYVFALRLGWLPTGGWQTREFFGFLEVGVLGKHIVLPLLALTLPGVAGVARLVRAQTLEVLGEDYVRMARAKGLPEHLVVMRHVLRNALLPIVTIMGFALAGLLSGSIFLETLLGIPGIGSYAFEAVFSRDYDGIMAIVLMGAAAFVVANLLVDIAYAFIDPRVRLGGREGT
ncbi:Oligopeptide transport system permease protein OppB [bacterium HR25]|jgi:ABC-type dipeptide/oligopeptide/nickel transport system permease component|nr:Oligopeptide transport system permease protein OppB [bacterium HR25]